MKQYCSGLLIVFFAYSCPFIGLARGDGTDEAYQLPLIDRYAVWRDDVTSGSMHEKGTFRLVEVEEWGLGSFTDVVPKVEQIAVVQKLIVGRAAQGLFLLDTSSSNPKPQFYEGLDKWRAALEAAGISGDVQLSNPDALAARVPNRTLRPWDYRVMHGLFGFEDDLWSLIVQCCGLVIALIIGLRIQRRQSAMMAAIVLGIVIDIVGLMVIAGEGPSAFVGLFAFPILFCFVAYIGRGVKWIASGRRKSLVIAT